MECATKNTIFDRTILITFILIAAIFIAVPTAKASNDTIDSAWDYYEKQEFSKAFNEFSKAAKMGDSDAQIVLGLMYEEGIGVKVDGEKAIDWFEKAIAQDRAEARVHLARLYLYGLGDIKPDHKKADELLRRAAE